MLDELNVIAGGLGQLVIVPHAADVDAPAGHGDLHGLGAGQAGRERELRRPLAVHLVFDADGDLLHVGKHVQLRERDLGRALREHAVAGGDEVYRADPPRPSRRGAVFAAGLAELLGLLAEPLAGERAFAHAARIRLHDADDPVDRQIRRAGADRRVRREGRRGGGVGIDAELDIPESAELRLVQDALALVGRLPEIRAGVPDVGLEDLAVGIEIIRHLAEAEGLRAVDAGDLKVFEAEHVAKVIHKVPAVEQLAHHDALLHVLVAVDRGDAALGGAVGLVRKAGFLEAVQRDVVGHDDDRAVADHEVLRVDADARAPQLLDLAAEMADIHHHAVAEDVHLLMAEDAGGQQVEREGAAVVLDRVAGVVAALIADDHVVILGHEVDHAALALVAPVHADYGAGLKLAPRDRSFVLVHIRYLFIRFVD